jgi:hypothetical protein
MSLHVKQNMEGKVRPIIQIRQSPIFSRNLNIYNYFVKIE